MTVPLPAGSLIAPLASSHARSGALYFTILSPLASLCSLERAWNLPSRISRTAWYAFLLSPIRVITQTTSFLNPVQTDDSSLNYSTPDKMFRLSPYVLSCLYSSHFGNVSDLALSRRAIKYLTHKGSVLRVGGEQGFRGPNIDKDQRTWCTHAISIDLYHSHGVSETIIRASLQQRQAVQV